MMNKAVYEVWLLRVVELLNEKKLSVAEAFDLYSFRAAYEEYNETPESAISDYKYR